jgi:hypothetical protein
VAVLPFPAACAWTRVVASAASVVGGVAMHDLRGCTIWLVADLEAFLAKPWPGYEVDVLVRDQIEGRKVLLPIWHGVDAETVRVHQPGVAGVVAPVPRRESTSSRWTSRV